MRIDLALASAQTSLYTVFSWVTGLLSSKELLSTFVGAVLAYWFARKSKQKDDRDAEISKLLAFQSMVVVRINLLDVLGRQLMPQLNEPKTLNAGTRPAPLDFGALNSLLPLKVGADLALRFHVAEECLDMMFLELESRNATLLGGMAKMIRSLKPRAPVDQSELDMVGDRARGHNAAVRDAHQQAKLKFADAHKRLILTAKVRYPRVQWPDIRSVSST